MGHFPSGRGDLGKVCGKRPTQTVQADPDTWRVAVCCGLSDHITERIPPSKIQMTALLLARSIFFLRRNRRYIELTPLAEHEQGEHPEGTLTD